MSLVGTAVDIPLDDFDYDYDYAGEPVKAIDVLDRQKNRIKQYENKIYWLQREMELMKATAAYEKQMRENHPSLQDAWEKYQIILRTIQ